MKRPDLKDAFKAIAQQVDARARRIRHWPLTGGVSAQIDALEFKLPGGKDRQLVVRRLKSHDWKVHDDHATATEFALQAALFRAGFAVPEPLLLDTSCAVLPAPFFVMAMVEGTTLVTEDSLQVCLQHMADFLRRLHNLDVETLEVSQLPRREDPVSGALQYVPDTAAQATLRAAIAGWQTKPSEDVLLHGDFWPGNVLWKDHQLAAVIDWEDAAIGPAVSDLAGCRAELMAMYGAAAMETFTQCYLAGTTLEISDLTLWEIYVGSAALASMADWGLEPEIEALRRERTALFVHRAADKLIHLKDLYHL